MKTFSSNDILDRLKTALSISSDKDLGDALGVSKAAVSNWRKRNSIDLERVFSVCEHINLDWLITGRGRMGVESNEPPVERSNSELMDGIVSQAEEIGRLKERNAQLERENMELRSISNHNFTPPKRWSRSSSSRMPCKRSDTGSATLLPQLTDLSRGRFLMLFNYF